MANAIVNLITITGRLMVAGEFQSFFLAFFIDTHLLRVQNMLFFYAVEHILCKKFAFQEAKPSLMREITASSFSRAYGSGVPTPQTGLGHAGSFLKRAIT